MIQITKIEDNLFHVINEPGDMTRYDYFVYRYGDTYRFMSKNNTFLYPSEINIFEVKDINRVKSTHKYQLESRVISNMVNPNTTFQCIKVMRTIEENY